MEGHRDLSGAPSGSRSLKSTRPPAGTRRGSHAPRRLLHADCGSAQSLANTASPQENRCPAKQAGARPRPLTSKPGRRRVAIDPRDHEAWARAQPRRDDCALRPRRDHGAGTAFPSPPETARLAALPAGPSQLTPGRNGPGPPQRPSPPRTLSTRPAAPPPSSPRALPKPLRRTLQQPRPQACVPPAVLPRPAAGRLPVGSAHCGATGKALRAGNPAASRPLVAAMRTAP